MEDKEQFFKEVSADFGNAVHELREVKGLTVEQAAEQAELTPTKMAAVERGSYHNNLSTMCRIVEALGGRLAIVPEESKDDPHCQFIEFDE